MDLRSESRGFVDTSCSPPFHAPPSLRPFVPGGCIPGHSAIEVRSGNKKKRKRRHTGNCESTRQTVSTSFAMRTNVTRETIHIFTILPFQRVLLNEREQSMSGSSSSGESDKETYHTRTLPRVTSQLYELSGSQQVVVRVLALIA